MGYEAMAKAQEEQIYENQESAKNINSYSADAQAAIEKAKTEWMDEIDILTDVVASNHAHVEKEFELLTGVVRDFKTAGEEDRANIRKMNEAMGADMRKAIQTAIQMGEARAKGVASKARESLANVKQSLLIEITDTVEHWADLTFKTVQGGFAKIADNYLSLKAYATVAEAEIVKYVGQGKGKNLSSLGDLLVNVAAHSHVLPTKKEGLFPEGEAEAKSIFSGGKFSVDSSVSKVNCLVMEFVTIASGVRERWPMGLGKYLLFKLEESMKGKGVLQVDKIDEKSGNWVFINGHAVGLSNKLNDFEGLAVRMSHYEAGLAKLTAALSGKIAKPSGPHVVYAPPPEWEGQ